MLLKKGRSATFDCIFLAKLNTHWISDIYCHKMSINIAAQPNIAIFLTSPQDIFRIPICPDCFQGKTDNMSTNMLHKEHSLWRFDLMLTAYHRFAPHYTLSIFVHVHTSGCYLDIGIMRLHYRLQG